MEAGDPQPRLLGTRVRWSPERRGGARGGGCGRDTACSGGGSSDGGATAEVALGAPPSAGSRWGQIFGESVAMGTGRFGKGELKGGWRCKVRAPQTAVAMTTTPVLARGRPGGVTDGRVGAGWGRQIGGWGRGASPKVPAATAESRLSQGAGRPPASPLDSLLPKLMLSLRSVEGPLCLLPSSLPALLFTF